MMSDSIALIDFVGLDRAQTLSIRECSDCKRELSSIRKVILVEIDQGWWTSDSSRRSITSSCTPINIRTRFVITVLIIGYDSPSVIKILDNRGQNVHGCASLCTRAVKVNV